MTSFLVKSSVFFPLVPMDLVFIALVLNDCAYTLKIRDGLKVLEARPYRIMQAYDWVVICDSAITGRGNKVVALVRFWCIVKGGDLHPLYREQWEIARGNFCHLISHMIPAPDGLYIDSSITSQPRVGAFQVRSFPALADVASQTPRLFAWSHKEWGKCDLRRNDPERLQQWMRLPDLYSGFTVQFPMMLAPTTFTK